jgi:hypothetical protein
LGKFNNKLNGSTKGRLNMVCRAEADVEAELKIKKSKHRRLNIFGDAYNWIKGAATTVVGEVADIIIDPIASKYIPTGGNGKMDVDFDASCNGYGSASLAGGIMSSLKTKIKSQISMVNNCRI